MMLTPWGPRAVPTGGAGVAAPAWSCTLTSAAIFFLGGIPFSLSRGHDGAGAPATCALELPRCGVVFRLTGFRDAPPHSLASLECACRSSTFSAFRPQTFWIWV